MKHRLRAPSPALVISLVALFLALGGTSYAAGKVITSKHKDAKADTKLVKKLAPTLSVKHATTADSATTAGSATTATSATSATSATNATHATSADTATALGTVYYRESQPIDSPGCGSSPCNGLLSDTPGAEVCPAGTVVIAGGITTSNGGLELSDGEPASSTGPGGPLDEWFVFVDNFTPNDESFEVWAQCVKAGAQDAAQVMKHNAPRAGR
jgi:hypothetical protein